MSAVGSQTIVMTGASAGIGRHAAMHLASKGHRVIAGARRLDALQAMAAEAQQESMPGAIVPVRLDVNDSESIEALRVEVERLTEGSGPDAVVNNAGYGQFGPIELLDDEVVRQQFNTNVFGLLAVTRAFLPAMRQRRSGRIVNISSVAGWISMPLTGVYNASKHAVEALTDALRVEARPFGIRVVSIQPGPIKTDFSDVGMGRAGDLPAQGTPYQRVLEVVPEIVKQFESQAFPPAVVSRDIERALTKTRPRAHYISPWPAGLLFGLLKAMPTPWRDAAFARMMKIDLLDDSDAATKPSTRAAAT